MNLTLPKPIVTVVLTLCAAVACTPAATTPSVRDRGAGTFFSGAPEIRGPEVDRCERYRKTTRDQFCQDAKYLGQSWARSLSPGDEVCLEGGVGEEVGASCSARASVADVGTNRVLIEIRSARPDSRFVDDVQKQAWYAEDALVDLFLAEQGW